MSGGPQIIKGYNMRGQLTPPAAFIPSERIRTRGVGRWGGKGEDVSARLLGWEVKRLQRDGVEQLNSKALIKISVPAAAQSDLGLRR